MGRSWEERGHEVAAVNFLTPRSSGCSVLRAGSHTSHIGSLPLSTKACCAVKGKQGQAPSREEKNLTDSKCSGDCGDPGSSGWWRSGIVGEK